MKLTDDHLQTFVEQGFVAVENFYPEQRRAQIAAAIRRTLLPWEALADDPPAERLLRDDFPYADTFFNEFIIDWDLIEFVQRVLDTEDIHFRYAHNWARYPTPGPSSRACTSTMATTRSYPPHPTGATDRLAPGTFPKLWTKTKRQCRSCPSPMARI